MIETQAGFGLAVLSRTNHVGLVGVTVLLVVRIGVGDVLAVESVPLGGMIGVVEMMVVAIAHVIVTMHVGTVVDQKGLEWART